jgi:hypothetical protein
MRFFERLSGSGLTGPVEGPSSPIPACRTIAQRERQSAEAEKRLTELGA